MARTRVANIGQTSSGGMRLWEPNSESSPLRVPPTRHSCKTGLSSVFNPSMVGKHVSTTGAYVTDIFVSSVGWDDNL